jgi:hypothetical protein
MRQSSLKNITIHHQQLKFKEPVIASISPRRTGPALLRFVIPDLRGPLGRDPDSTPIGFVLWMPAYTGMTVFFPDW